MVSPDQKIDPNKEIYRDRSQDVRRKPPTKEFHEYSERIEERRYSNKEEEEEQLKTKQKKKTGSAPSESKQEQAPLSLFDLARNFKDAADEEDSSSDRSTSTLEKKKKEHDIYSTIEQPDLSSAINLSPQLNASSTSIESKPPLVSTPIQEIIDQIAKEVYILKDSGRTETVISLKGNFEGSNLIITENASAPGEINVTIDNLTAINQYLLEKNKHTLVEELANKNIVVHIFTATTTQELNRTAYTEESSGHPREKNRERNDQEKQEQDS